MISEGSPLVLASASPRRREILSSLGIPFFALGVNADESLRPREASEDYVLRVSEAKLEAVLERECELPAGYRGILVADTIVTLEDQILMKPRDDVESLKMIGSLCGRTHEVLTAYLIQAPDGRRRTRTVRTRVTLREAAPEELLAYVRTGEGLDKAGAYGIQGRASFLVERIEGSYSSVVGLPICEVIIDLKELALLASYP